MEGRVLVEAQAEKPAQASERPTSFCKVHCMLMQGLKVHCEILYTYLPFWSISGHKLPLTTRWCGYIYSFPQHNLHLSRGALLTYLKHSFESLVSDMKQNVTCMHLSKWHWLWLWDYWPGRATNIGLSFHWWNLFWCFEVVHVSKVYTREQIIVA